jgi:cytochrome c oxidase assembly protein subunit 15
MDEKRRAFYKLCLSTLIAVYILIFVGGIVRSTGSGMGCPDWPRCFGNWVPPTSVMQLPPDYKATYSAYREKKNVKFARYLRFIGLNETADKILLDKSVLQEADFNVIKTWVEYFNRIVGVIIGLLITAMFVASLKFWKTKFKLTLLSLASLILVVFQGWLGSFVVSTNLTPWTITIHMFLALLIVALLIYLLDQSYEQPKEPYSPVVFWVLINCIAVLLIQVLLGTQVREAIDRVAAVTVRTEWIRAIQGDLILHRSFSWIVLILHGILILNLRKTTGLKTFSIALILLILGTFLTGVGMAYFAVPSFLQPLHLLLATLSFGMQFMLLLKLGKREKIALEI